MGIKSISLGVTALILSTSVESALILTIDNYTTDELSFSISGTFDTDTTGELPGYLGIKNDWSNNVGIHTELFNSIPTVSFNSISIGGANPTTFVADNGATGDSVTFRNPAGIGVSLTAGTQVLGSVILTGVGMFNPSNASSLELLSGYDSSTEDWHRLEASAINAVPVPAAVWLFGSGLIGLIGLARRKA